ncbi:unnamed protein product [Brachionus calyciflorus]|uniref:Uncharacterized protein n=1 Tax=Brachionus calyciflorus TaxID=104777 RepID=A0A814PNY4_9BILA|nr:unnamed protein product [Brachionus calyciflorus]
MNLSSSGSGLEDKTFEKKYSDLSRTLRNQEEKIKLALNSKVNEINGQITILKDTLSHYKKHSLLFQIDLFKVLNPNLPKLSNEQISNIHKLYNNYSLNQDNNLSLAEFLLSQKNPDLYKYIYKVKMNTMKCNC